ncbi:MAG: hypothetical protein E5X53_30810 [Mesorhizobium sp.]|uniref:hypothetical protein n=1 Tax=Mesorhizobium sp. TaxID=1871066 RepID=UPI001225FF33|nr:hypothetical protein [Mesorhizobium sp.]TIP69779.1 MAG: hypothetical protein E5X55_30615 [Mesorhizobium sp.]TIQ04346.1 MAG: hypothetical protein E5X57_29490 [Mesorhizobium sp.]TIR48150.1 MAG: hypothetical protein E5X53_30810 [Mesorhizobium sp.]TJV94554.1 MAG: hypothetical protein E5X52_28480 [Mesorhizobium sp.]
MSETVEPSPFRVRSVRERWEETLKGRISWALFKTILNGDDGPVLTRLSERKVGIRQDHWERWLDSRDEKASEARKLRAATEGPVALPAASPSGSQEPLS